MYKYYKKDEYNVMYYKFNSLTEFIHYLDKTPTNTRVFSSNINYVSSHSRDKSFCGTSSYEEAVKQCLYGKREGFEEFKILRRKLSQYIKMKNERPRQHKDFVGYAPNVAAYLNGDPMSMFNKSMTPKKNIEIYFNVAVLSNVTPNQIYNKGLITLSLIDLLESYGYSVKLHMFAMSSCKYQIHFSEFLLKGQNEKINLQKLYFPMTNPSFLRRLVFRLREVTPNIEWEWRNGYGYSCNSDIISKFLDLEKNNIIISNPNEIGIKGIDIVEDANTMFTYLEKVNQEALKDVDLTNRNGSIKKRIKR